MSYHPTECIFDLIAASGPQDRRDCIRECVTQCVPFPSSYAAGLVVVTRALQTLIDAGIIESDGDAWDLTEYGYELVQQEHARVHRLS